MERFSKALRMGLILIAVFCVTFYFFYKRAQKNLSQPLILTSAVINQPLPKAELINVSGNLLDDANLRQGKVILAFTLTNCPPCDKENEFLRAAVNRRPDVKFVYVIPFGNRELVLKAAKEKYSFETFFDDGSMLSRSLQVYEVPLKVFVEDGIIRNTWVEPTVTDQGKAAFNEWLTGL
jgi:peroxiredoxin